MAIESIHNLQKNRVWFEGLLSVCYVTLKPAAHLT